MSRSKIEFTISLKNATLANGTSMTTDAIYELISQQKFAQYQITAIDTVQLQGSIQSMLFNTLDATNCWEISTLTYDISYVDKFVQVDVKPNFCNISKHVFVTMEWSFSGTN